MSVTLTKVTLQGILNDILRLVPSVPAKVAVDQWYGEDHFRRFQIPLEQIKREYADHIRRALNVAWEHVSKMSPQTLRQSAVNFQTQLERKRQQLRVIDEWHANDMNRDSQELTRAKISAETVERAATEALGRVAEAHDDPRVAGIRAREARQAARRATDARQRADQLEARFTENHRAYKNRRTLQREVAALDTKVHGLTDAISLVRDLEGAFRDLFTFEDKILRSPDDDTARKEVLHLKRTLVHVIENILTPLERLGTGF